MSLYTKEKERMNMRARMLVRLLLLAVLLAAAAAAAASADRGRRATHRHRLSSVDHRNREHMFRRAESFKMSLTSTTENLPPKAMILSSGESPNSRIYHVIDYGADPTGTNDSTEAIGKAVADAFRGLSGQALITGITDLGGAEIHLDGGTYLISSPVALPGGGGNVKVHSGSLRATTDFPSDRYLIELWANPQPSSLSAVADATANFNYEFITLSSLLLDANFRGGGIAVVNSLRTTITDCYISHFTSDGIWVSSGHETYISQTYIGQHITAGGDLGERNFSGTGISLMGNDNAVTDVVIFSAGTGVLVSGQANALTGVHCYNKATGWGGVGIYLKLPGLTQTRIVNCYLDYTGIVTEDPDQLHISSSFFLGSADIVLRSVKGVARGVDIVDNIFSGGGADIVRLDESNGPAFSDVDQVYVERNIAVDGMRMRSTVAEATVVANGTTWTVDFSGILLFPDRIGNVQYSVLSVGSGFPKTVLRNVSHNVVMIESDVAAAATVYVMVDQSVGSMA